MYFVFIHWPDCPTGPGFVHFCSCICAGIALSHSETRRLSESGEACAGHMLPGGTEKNSYFNHEDNAGYAIGCFQCHLWKTVPALEEISVCGKLTLS